MLATRVFESGGAQVRRPFSVGHLFQTKGRLRFISAIDGGEESQSSSRLFGRRDLQHLQAGPYAFRRHHNPQTI
jgi:hypothetical protein